MTRAFTVAAAALLLASALSARQRETSTKSLDGFFGDFTAEWVRGNPNLATSTRYFTGEAQDRLERQLTPQTDAYRRARIRLAKQGLAELRAFDRRKLAATQRVSADLMEWQLDTFVREEPFLDYTFPLEQMNGVNIGLVETLTVRHPLLNEKDAGNYVAALGQVGTRMEEAISESRRLAGRGIIPKEMDAVLRRIGRTEGSVKERTAKLSVDLRYPNPTSEESRAQIMRDIDGIIRDAEKRASLLFDVRPKSPVIARPFPSFREANAAANYNSPAPDGSRPGTFQYPRRLDRMTKFSLRSVVYHETVPGHHFQIALQVENKDLPRFRQIGAFGGISALSEGWGLYAERLAAESGWYDGDPEGLLGQLDDELFRARRLVVDTGLHAMHWTRQQAIDYGIEASEVERYTVYPGQACSYMIGELKILELRDKAKQALGDKFSLQQFHNVVLATGTVPLELLERQVDTYLRSERGKQ